VLLVASNYLKFRIPAVRSALNVKIDIMNLRGISRSLCSRDHLGHRESRLCDRDGSVVGASGQRRPLKPVRVAGDG
jgi:hypothetical protein